MWKKGWSCVSHIFAVLVLVLYGKGFKNPLTPSIKAGGASRVSLAVGISSCLKRGLQTPSQGGAAPPSHFLPYYCTTSQLRKKVLQFNKHELSTYSVLGTKDLQLSRTSSLPCLSVGVICGCLNLVNYTSTCFLRAGEAPKGRDGVLQQ